MTSRAATARTMAVDAVLSVRSIRLRDRPTPPRLDHVEVGSQGWSLAKINLHRKAIFAENVLAPAVSTALLLANPREKAVHQIRVVVNAPRRELVDPR